MPKKIVLSLGGSIVNPGKINVEFLQKFRELILRNIGECQFYIVVGGGRPAREYQQALRDLSENDVVKLDNVGIAATRLNAELIRLIFSDIAAPKVFIEPEEMLAVEANVYVSGGTNPGWSTDFVTMNVAKAIGVDTVVNFLDFDYLHTANPKFDPTATPIESISFEDLRKMVGDTWTPGANVAFDPIAARFAAEEKIKVVMLNAFNLDNFEKYLRGEEFVGTKVGF